LLVLQPVRVLLTIAMLFHASVYDIKTREIPPKLWVAYGAPLVAIALAELLARELPFHLGVAYAMSVVIAAAVTLPLYAANLLGGADVIALFVAALSHPYAPFREPAPFPFSLLLLMYTLVPIAAFPALFFAYNVARRNYKLLRGASSWRRALLLFLGIPIKAGDLAGKKFWYPLQRPWSGELKLSFSVDENDEELRRRLWELIERGEVRPEEPIWATYGIPTIPFILAGYLLTLIMGYSLLEWVTRVG